MCFSLRLENVCLSLNENAEALSVGFSQTISISQKMPQLWTVMV